MGATYNNTEQSKWLFVKLSKYDVLEIICILDVTGDCEDTVAFPYSTCKNFTWNSGETEVNLECRPLIFDAAVVFGLCPVAAQIQKWKSSLDVWHWGSFSIVSTGIVKGLAGVELDLFRPLSFTAQTPAGIHSDTPCCTPQHKLALRYPASDCTPLECGLAPSISPLDLPHMLILCTLTFLHSFSPFMLLFHVLAAIFCLSKSLQVFYLILS